MEFSERQTRIITTAATVLALVIILAASAALTWLVTLFLRSFSHVLLPPAVAAVIALVVEPYYRLLNRRLGLPMPLALLTLMLSALLPAIAFAWFFGALLVDQLAQLVEQFPAWWETTRQRVEQR
ncbi:MAG TPA: AI-2E family transporter, partial [Candidatus Polarisedimenticolaceae bacterium]|nr:AI-2E family transporter [Candidatus Polarisedimenticolaceae bacterium]